MKRNFLGLGIVMMIGIIFFYNVAVKISLLYFIFMTIGLLISILFIYGKLNKLLIGILSFILGGILVNSSLNGSVLKNFENKEIDLIGTILEEVSSNEYSSKYYIDITEVYNNDKHYSVNEKMLLKIIGNNKLTIGDKINFNCILTDIKRNSNPKLFNYQLYLKTKGIYVTTVINQDVVIKICSNNISKFHKYKIRLKDKINNILDSTLDNKNSSIMKAIFFGDDYYLEHVTLTIYRELGIAHVLAVSGLHIGIISGFLLIVLKFFYIERKFMYIISAIIVWMYGYLIGYPVSILRALFMFTFFIMSEIFYKRYDILNILFLSMIILLIFNPLWVFSVSFQLSFLIVFSLSVFTKRIYEFFKPDFLKLGKIIAPLLAVQIGSIPIMIYHFNFISLVSIFANLIIIPIFSIIIILNFILIITGFININIAKFIGIFINIGLKIIHIITMFIDENIRLFFTVTSLNIKEIFIYYILVFIILKIIRLHKFDYKVKKIIFIYVSILILFDNSNFLNNSALIQFIDVGQGDCALVRYKNKNFLIDTGGAVGSNFNVAENIVIPYLLKNKVSRLNGVFVSHFDYDHCGALPDLIDKIDIDNIYISYLNLEKELCDDIIKKSSFNDTPVKIINSNHRFIIDKNCTITILNPDENINDNLSENNLSLVLLLEIYENKILFTGDIESDVEKQLVSKNNIDIDILKVPHHGSKTSSSDDFISAFKPEYALVSVGKNNYNHPNYEVLNRYKNKNIIVYRTDEDGLVTIEISDDYLKISSYLSQKQSTIEVIINNYDKIIFHFLYIIISILLINKYRKIIIKI